MEVITGRKQPPLWPCCHLIRADGGREVGPRRPFLRGPPTSPGSITDVSQDPKDLAPLTTEKQLFQFVEQLGTLIQLLLETLGRVVIHIAGPQQLPERLQHGVHVLTTNDTDAMPLLNLLPLKGELPGLGLN